MSSILVTNMTMTMYQIAVEIGSNISIVIGEEQQLINPATAKSITAAGALQLYCRKRWLVQGQGNPKIWRYALSDTRTTCFGADFLLIIYHV